MFPKVEGRTKGLITVHRQAILLLVVESGTRKLRKVVESRTTFPFDVKRVLDSTTACPGFHANTAAIMTLLPLLSDWSAASSILEFQY